MLEENILAETLAGAERSAFWLRSITRKPKADLYQNMEQMPRRTANKCCPETSFPTYNHVKNVATGSLQNYRLHLDENFSFLLFN